MSLHLSTGLRNHILAGGSLKQFLNGAIMLLFDGFQPADADVTHSCNTLNTITLSSGAHTPETIATGTVELTGGASGSVDGITVDSIQIMSGSVSFNSTLAQTAADVAANINAFISVPRYKAAVLSGAIITIYASVGSGVSANGLAVVSSSTTVTTSDANMASGVTAVNGLTFGVESSGAISKSGTWSGTATASGVPAWYRIVRKASEAAGASTTYLRLDGSVSLSGADLNLSPCSQTSGVSQTIDTFSYTEPAS
jgi:hypothetical protein